MPDVLITGGAGFIGSRLAAVLHSEGWRVVVLDALHPQVHPDGRWPAHLPDGVERHRVDITDGSGVEDVVGASRPDVVVHLAAETGTGQSLTEARRHGMVNVVGTTTLMDAMTRLQHLPGHLLLASSRAVYGEGMWREAGTAPFHPLPRDPAQVALGRWDPIGPSGPAVAVAPEPQRAGTVEPRPTNVYAATKLAQEHLLGAWSSALGVRLSVLRLQNVYGPGQSLANPYTGVLNIFAQRSLAGRPIEVYEDGLPVRDFVYIDDVIAAFRLALTSEVPGPVLADIGSGQPSTLLDVARLVAQLAGGPDPVVTGRYRPGDVRAAWADVAPARETLGLGAPTDLRTGIGRLLDWIRDEVAGQG